MENEEKHCLKFLEDRPYRYLQQMAKSLGLPSNFKVQNYRNLTRLGINLL